jgi:hypothetical protein
MYIYIYILGIACVEASRRPVDMGKTVSWGNGKSRGRELRPLANWTSFIAGARQFVAGPTIFDFSRSWVGSAARAVTMSTTWTT